MYTRMQRYSPGIRGRDGIYLYGFTAQKDPGVANDRTAVVADVRAGKTTFSIYALEQEI